MELNEIVKALPALLGTAVVIALIVLFVIYQIKKWSNTSKQVTIPAEQSITSTTEEQLHKATPDFHYSTLIETMREALLYVDNDDYLQFANQRFYDLVGYTEQELKAGPLLKIIVPEEYQHIILEKNNLRKKKVNDWYEIPFKHKSGKLIWVKISASHLQNKKGEVKKGMRYAFMLGKTFFVAKYFNTRMDAGFHYMQTFVDGETKFNPLLFVEAGLVFYF